MIGWGIFAAWLLVSAIVGRALLRIIMSRSICTTCRDGWFTGKCFYHSRFDGPRVMRPLGEVMERPIGFAVVAALAGLAWPFTGLVVIVMHAPRTPDELSRHNAEMADTIRRLESDLKRGAS